MKIDGDDAVDFFIALENEFKVYISSFNLSRFFNAEGFDPIGMSKWLTLMIGRKNISILGIRESINFGHLMKAIKEGRLDDSIFSE